MSGINSLDAVNLALGSKMLKLSTMKILSATPPSQRLSLAAVLAAISLASTTLSSAATIELTQPYTPTGENYKITAGQGFNPQTLGGGTTVGANPNVNLAFQGGFGVRYTNSSGSLVDYGIGLYDSSAAPGVQPAATILNVAFDQIVSSQGLSVTLGHLGITDLSTDFNTGKVAPTISIYGTLGLADYFSASDILAHHALTLLTSNDPIAQTDLWKLDVEALVGPNAQIYNITLGADTHNGSGASMTIPSDPYFLASVNGGDCAMVPEPGSAFLILSAGLGGLVITRRRNRSLFSAR
jgi:hypothetical protein